MKKLALFAIAISFSYGASATPITSSEVTQADCPLLAEGVRLSLSNAVVGAYNCNETPATKGIYVATCSTAGRTTPRTIELDCNPIGSKAGDPGFITGAATCDAEGNGEIVEFRGSFIYQASTRGGRVTPSQEANQECVAATVDAVAAP